MRETENTAYKPPWRIYRRIVFQKLTKGSYVTLPKTGAGKAVREDDFFFANASHFEGYVMLLVEESNSPEALALHERSNFGRLKSTAEHTLSLASIPGL